jgi:hypothetical protein
VIIPVMFSFPQFVVVLILVITEPVISSVNIPTIPLTVAQTMNPAPRPPSPGARDATQRAMRRENPRQLSTRDAQVLMGLGVESNIGYLPERADVDDLHGKANGSCPQAARNCQAPPRPNRNSRTSSSTVQQVHVGLSLSALHGI